MPRFLNYTTKSSYLQLPHRPPPHEERRAGDLFRFPRFRLRLRRLKADVRQERDHVVGRVGKKHRDPVQLVHVVGGIDAVGRAEGAEHFGRQLQVDHVDDLVAVETEFATGNAHRDGVPFSAVAMPQDGRFRIPVEGVIRRGAKGRQTVRKKGLLGHHGTSFFDSATIIPQTATKIQPFRNFSPTQSRTLPNTSVFSPTINRAPPGIFGGLSRHKPRPTGTFVFSPTINRALPNGSAFPPASHGRAERKKPDGLPTRFRNK